MESNRFEEITSRYSELRIAVVGDYSCDRYLEIDPSKEEISIETNLPVYNVTKVRAQPGASGTVLNNLAALGAAELWPVGFCGSDGEGFELQRALKKLPGVQMDYFFESEEQRTFTYCKPLVMNPAKPPRELNRLDSKNWHPTPQPLQEQLAGAVGGLARKVDAIIVLDQVDEPETGVVTQNLLHAINDIRDQTLIIGDSRRGLKGWPDIIYKMNMDELTRLTGKPGKQAKEASSQLAEETGQPVFEEQEIDLNPLPFIIVVIDETSKLFTSALNVFLPEKALSKCSNVISVGKIIGGTLKNSFGNFKLFITKYISGITTTINAADNISHLKILKIFILVLIFIFLL